MADSGQNKNPEPRPISNRPSVSDEQETDVNPPSYQETTTSKKKTQGNIPTAPPEPSPPSYQQTSTPQTQPQQQVPHQQVPHQQPQRREYVAIRVYQRSGFGPYPTEATCPVCGYKGYTVTKKKPGLCTWLSVLFMCLFCIICFFIPLFISSFQDTKHYCSNCHACIGEHRALD